MALQTMAVIGEVMLELRPASGGRYSMGFAGDTFNTAVALSRLGVDTAYVTMLGRDRFSQDIVEFAKQERLDTSAILRAESALPGLYLIENDEHGERQFHYWRESSAARELLTDRERMNQVLEYLERFDAVYLSGISAAVMGLPAEDNFWALIDALKRRGKRLFFDPNYRARLWPDSATAAQWCDRIARHCDWVFPTLADERELWGCDSEQAALDHYRALGVGEIVLKCPNAVAVALRDKEQHRLASLYKGPVVDTTGAGDAFNAGYTAARLRRQHPEAALAVAHEAAARVIAVAGAIPLAGTYKEGYYRDFSFN